MARLVLVALVWSAVQGEEYGAGGMPHYGGVAADYAEPAAAVASADYTGHSPDAPAPLDYKYIEDPLGRRDRFQKDVDGTNEWEQKPKERRSRHDKDELDIVDSEPAVSKHKPSRRSRHRSRLKSEKTRESRRRRSRTNRDNEDSDDLKSPYIRNNDYRDEIKSEPLDEEHILIKETTERVIRRKARDRHFAPPPKSIDLEAEDDQIIKPLHKSPAKGILESDDEVLGSFRKMKDDDDKSESDYNINTNRRKGRPPGPTFDMEDDDDIDPDLDLKKKSTGKRKYIKNYPDYNAYYDMNRVYNIKNRLPMLLRRTTTTIPSLEEEDSTSDILKMLWTARRAASPCTIALRTRTTITTTSTTTITTSTTTTMAPVVIPLTQSTTTPTPPSTAFLQFSETPSTKKQLSLAEKSRLSILKKAYRKESDRSTQSTKPPILLRVTNKIPTIVMVEPPGADPWMRAREVSNDSPERLERVKRLMRQKLVSDAKNIKDLTDNWDDMVCDYIDTSLLDSQACNRKLQLWLLIFCYALCYLVSKNV